LIIAKPFKRKGLGQSTSPENSVGSRSNLARKEYETSSKEELNTFKENYVDVKRKSLHGKLAKVVYMIVRDRPALTTAEIADYLRSFCHYQGYIEEPLNNEVSDYLSYLVRQGSIVRIKVDKTFRYVRRLTDGNDGI
jgi:hypothetical protein